MIASYSRTIYTEQIDLALTDYLKSAIQLRVDRPVKVKVRKPDEDFKREEYPLISIYNLYQRYNTFRRANQNEVQIARDVENNTGYYEKTSIPMDLYYQIDFWSTLQREINDMLRQWLTYTDGGREFNLPVENESGCKTTRYAFCTDQVRRNDFLKDSDRIFHAFTTFRIYGEIDEGVRYERSIITQPVFITNTWNKRSNQQ